MTEKPRPLTALDLDVLRAVAAGQVWQDGGGGTMYDSFSDADQTNWRNKVNQQVKKLAARDLICIGGQGKRRWSLQWVITEAGEAELAKQKGE